MPSGVTMPSFQRPSSRLLPARKFCEFDLRGGNTVRSRSIKHLSGNPAAWGKIYERNMQMETISYRIIQETGADGWIRCGSYRRAAGVDRGNPLFVLPPLDPRNLYTLSYFTAIGMKTVFHFFSLPVTIKKQDAESWSRTRNVRNFFINFRFHYCSDWSLNSIQRALFVWGRTCWSGVICRRNALRY